jgi:hypothetical protein
VCIAVRAERPRPRREWIDVHRPGFHAGEHRNYVSEYRDRYQLRQSSDNAGSWEEQRGVLNGWRVLPPARCDGLSRAEITTTSDE